MVFAFDVPDESDSPYAKFDIMIFAVSELNVKIARRIFLGESIGYFISVNTRTKKMEATTHKKKKTTNHEQFAKLIDEMEKNPDIARGFPSVGKTKETVNQFWDELTVVLNSLGPPVKKCVDWRKVWNDYKRHIKNKIANNKAEITATGGGPNVSQQYSLSPLEQQVDALINLSSSGAPSGRSYGPKSKDITTNEVSTDILYSSSLELCEEDNDENNANLFNIRQLNTPRSKPRTNPGLPDIEKERMKLLDQQTKNQKEILDTLKNIDRNTNNQQYYTNKKNSN